MNILLTGMKLQQHSDYLEKIMFISLNLLWTLCQGLWLRDVMAWVEDHLADKLAEEGTKELNTKNIYNILTWRESVKETSATEYRKWYHWISIENILCCTTCVPQRLFFTALQ